jgi:phenylpropionate dioxygenase-like ring-hydroxylating dioxygenase large terminal subunit
MSPQDIGHFGGFENLVQPDRVHKSVYADPQIFELEMDRIFGRAWIYVGHESQVPNVGDYAQALIGREKLFMIRDADGHVNVLFNRCAHKGAALVAFPSGNAGKFLRCPFHGWSYRCDGALHSVPVREGYAGTRFDMAGPAFSVRRVPRQASVRGFVFASLAEDGPDLDSFLGGIKSSIDNFCDRAPSGEVEVAGGVFRVWQHSNWKIFFENLNDTSHPMVTHESSVNAARAEYKSLPPGSPMPFRLHIIEGNGEPYEFWDRLEMVGFDNGHSYMGAIFKPPTDPVSLAYIETLKAAYGEVRAPEILKVQRHNSIIYPSCSPHTSFQQLRVIRPIAVDKTLVEIYTFRLKGAPEALFHRAITYANVVNSPSSNVMPDDIEVYARCQQGLSGNGGDWVSQHRDFGRDRPIDGGFVGNGLSELPMRNQFRAWAQYMARGT